MYFRRPPICFIFWVFEFINEVTPCIKKTNMSAFLNFYFQGREKKKCRGPVGLDPARRSGGNVALENQRQSRWPFQGSRVPGAERPPHTCSARCTWGVVDASVPPGASTRERLAAPRFPPPAPRPPCPWGGRDKSRNQLRSLPPSRLYRTRGDTRQELCAPPPCSAGNIRNPLSPHFGGGWGMCPTFHHQSPAPASLVTPHRPVPASELGCDARRSGSHVATLRRPGEGGKSRDCLGRGHQLWMSPEQGVSSCPYRRCWPDACAFICTKRVFPFKDGSCGTPSSDPTG